MIDKKVDDKNYSNTEKARTSSATSGSDSERYQNWYQAQANQQPYSHYQYKKLYRSTRDKWLGGVCGGIAEYYQIDPVLVRLLWVVLTIFSVGVGIIAYVLFWIFVNKNPGYYTIANEYVTHDKKGAKHYHYHYKLTE